jgi:hypothetical protein
MSGGTRARVAGTRTRRPLTPSVVPLEAVVQHRLELAADLVTVAVGLDEDRRGEGGGT